MGIGTADCGFRTGDVRYSSTKVVALDNGFDQGVYVESHRGIFPTLGWAFIFQSMCTRS